MNIKGIALYTIFTVIFWLPKLVVASSIVISAGTGGYGLVSGQPGPGNPDPIIVSNPLQSFIAIDSYLVSASIPLSSDAYINNDVYWQFQLRADNNGQPGDVMSTFGAFNPEGIDYNLYTSNTDKPIKLITGSRYYLGIIPIGDILSPPVDHLSAQYGSTSFDEYVDGTGWIILHNRGELGVPLMVETDRDFNITINFSPVPIPAAVWLFSAGLISLISIARKDKK